MIKKILTIITLVLCLLTIASQALPVYASPIKLVILDSKYGVVDGETIKHIPHMLDVKKFLGSVSGAYGSSVKTELFDVSGEKNVTEGFVQDDMKLKAKSGDREAVYTLKLTPLLEKNMFSYYSATSNSYPAHGVKTFDYPVGGIVCLEGSITKKDYTLSSFDYTLRNENWIRAIRFTDKGKIEQFLSNSPVSIPYELGKQYHFVVIMDFDNSRTWFYLNGVLMSTDKVNGDTHANFRPGFEFVRMTLTRDAFDYIKVYRLPSVDVFDISDYQSKIKSKNEGVVIDNESSKISILDENIKTIGDLYESLDFADDEERGRVEFYDRMNEKISDENKALNKTIKLVATSKNGLTKVHYNISVGSLEKDYFDSNPKDFNKLGVLKSVGVFASESKVDADALVLRDEFAQCLATITNSIFMGEISKLEFSDVSKSNKKRSAICAVAEQGFMSGRGSGEFDASEKITYNEAITALVRAAGYEGYAKTKGGYPSGYIYAAQRAGIIKGIEKGGNNELTNLDAIRLLYNTLLAPLNEVVFLSEGVEHYESHKENTMLSKYHNVYKGEGRVTANKDTDLYSESKDIHDDLIEVDGKLYNVSDGKNYDAFLGMEVDLFYHDDNGAKTVLFMSKKEYVSDITIKAEDLHAVTDSKVTYFDKDAGKQEAEARLEAGFTFIYNGRVYSDRTASDLLIPDGVLTLVDGSGNGSYDTVIASCPELYLFEGRDTDSDILYAEGISFNLKEEDIRIYVITKDGVTVESTMENIVSPALLSVFRTKDNKLTQIYIYENAKEGEVTEKNEDVIVIGESKFKINPSFDTSSIEIGHSYNFLFDSYGRLAATDSEISKEKYGYLIGFQEPKRLNENSKVRLVTAAKSYTDYEFADNVEINDVKVKQKLLKNHPDLYTAGELTLQLAKFRLNSKGQIYELHTGMEGVPVSGRYINYSGVRMLNGEYAIESDTFILNVPTYGDEGLDYKLYRAPSFANDNTYSLVAYDIREDNSCGAMLSIKTESQIHNTNVSMYSNTGVVKKTSKGIHISGEIYDFITIIHNGQEKLYYANEESYANESNLKFGDIVRFVSNLDNTLSQILLEFRVDSKNENPQSTPEYGTATWFEYRYGVVQRTAKNYHVINNQLKSNISSIIPFAANKYYKVDFNSKTIAMAKKDDFIPNKTYVYSRGERSFAASIVVGYAFENE